MNDTPKIITGLALFVVLITSPVWINLAGSREAAKLDVVYATKDIPGREKCVRETPYMTEQHMNLLNQWRDQAVRKNQRVDIAPDGRKFNKSLTHTCMDCHSNKTEFCDRCHDYFKVSPYCWDCHTVPDSSEAR